MVGWRNEGADPEEKDSIWVFLTERAKSYER